MKNHRIYLDQQWLYQPDPKSTKQQVDLPHTNQLFSYNYVQNQRYDKIVVYEKTIQNPGLSGDCFLVFESILHHAFVYLNDQLIHEQLGGYLAFEIPIVLTQQTCTIKVILDAHEQSNIPPFGGVIDYLTYGGINGHVYLEYRSHVRLEHTWFYCDETMNGYVQARLVGCQKAMLSILIDGLETTSHVTQDILVPIKTNHLIPWSIDCPKQYDMHLTLISDDVVQFSQTIKIGIKYTTFKSDGFYLNHERIKLMGLNRHQSFPTVGYATTDSLEVDDAINLKKLGINVVRTAHYPHRQAFFDACDALGILVITEIPGWQHIGASSTWRQTTLNNTRNMVLQYRHHVSIILWGVRINESQDDDDLYRLTNQIAHEHDPIRQTIGVRFIKHSHLLEDVYGFNDFSYTGNGDAILNPASVFKGNAPYLITEHTGHMFPTKRFDDEHHRAMHALRHARIINDANLNNRVSGVIGWCMNDYHTHQDFGSGDQICYHGVQDLYRVPKFASFVYQSQQDDTIVLESSSVMNMGDHASASIQPWFVLTNCDYIELWKDNTYIQSFYPSKDFPGLKHPPIFIDDFFGNQLETKEGYTTKQASQIKAVLMAVYQHGQDQLPIAKKAIMAKLLMQKVITFEKGYELYVKYVGNWGIKRSPYVIKGFKNKQHVATNILEPVKTQSLKATLLHHPLVEKQTYDMSLLQITVVDQNGHLLDYCFDFVRVICPEGVEVIGDCVASFKGGSVGFMIKSCHQVVHDVIKIETSFDQMILPIQVLINETSI